MYISSSDSDSDSDIDARLLQINNDIEEICSSINVLNDNIIYQGLSYLNTNLRTISQNIDSSINYNVNICAYHINSSLKIPFLQFFLYKPFSTTNNSTNLYDCYFPHFQYKSTQDIYMKAINTIDILCHCHYKDTKFDFKGYFIENSNIYLFFDCSHMKIDTLKMTKANDLWLVTIDEIINHNKVCNFSIDSKIVDLFHDYEKLSYLTMRNGEYYDMPTIAYSACPMNKIDFISTFGLLSQKSIFGNHLYFTDYQSAILKYDSNNYVGLLRCIIFLGKMKIIRNLPDDPNDQSTLSKNNPHLLNRITDYDSIWSLSHDSVFIGKVTLDDDSIFTSGPIWTIQNDTSQYSILSSHVFKVVVKDIPNNEYNTYIM